MASPHREFKNRLYGQFARIGKALSSPHRLEILELLAQGERSVDSLSQELGLSLANTSQHLQALRQAALVEPQEGLFVHYRLADAAVYDVCRAIRTVAERQLAELDRLVGDHFVDRSSAEAVSVDDHRRSHRRQSQGQGSSRKPRVFFVEGAGSPLLTSSQTPPCLRRSSATPISGRPASAAPRSRTTTVQQ